MAKGKGGKSPTTVNAGTTISKGGLICQGNVCYNPDTGKIEVKLEREGCPPDIVEGIIKSVLKGSEVEFVLPKRKV